MLKRTALLSVAVFLCCVFVTDTQGQSDFVDMRGSLQGLPGVYVLIEKVTDEAISIGLTRERFQTIAELELRKAGIKVLTEEESRKHATFPTLYIPTVVGFIEGGFMYAVRVVLQQNVTLATGTRTAAETWSSNIYVGVAPRKGQEAATEAVVKFVQDFANDFLAANPPTR